MVRFAEKRVVEDTIKVEKGEYAVKEQYYALKLGYCKACSAELYLKETEALTLYSWLKRKVDRS